jgi:hypothetical protein
MNLVGSEGENALIPPPAQPRNHRPLTHLLSVSFYIIKSLKRAFAQQRNNNGAAIKMKPPAQPQQGGLKVPSISRL